MVSKLIIAWARRIPTYTIPGCASLVYLPYSEMSPVNPCSTFLYGFGQQHPAIGIAPQAPRQAPIPDIILVYLLNGFNTAECKLYVM